MEHFLPDIEAKYHEYVKKKSGRWGRVGEFPGGPLVKNPGFQHGGHGFDPWLGKLGFLI